GSTGAPLKSSRHNRRLVGRRDLHTAAHQRNCPPLAMQASVKATAGPMAARIFFFRVGDRHTSGIRRVGISSTMPPIRAYWAEAGLEQVPPPANPAPSLVTRLRPLHRLGNRAARQHADEVRTIFGAAMDIAAHPISLDRHALERLRPKALLERLLERRHAE